jgi:hypothetical protein
MYHSQDHSEIMMINKVKRFISRFTSTPIYKGTGVTTLDTERSVKRCTTTPPGKLYKLNGTDKVFRLVNIERRNNTGALYFVMRTLDGVEGIDISPSLFDDIFELI